MITIYLKQYNKIIRNADTKLFDERCDRFPGGFMR